MLTTDGTGGGGGGGHDGPWEEDGVVGHCYVVCVVDVSDGVEAELLDGYGIRGVGWVRGRDTHLETGSGIVPVRGLGVGVLWLVVVPVGLSLADGGHGESGEGHDGKVRRGW